MDIRALSGSSGRSDSLEGRIESVQDGKAVVRLAGGTEIEVPVDREFPVGAPVRVAVATDGTPSLSLRGPDVDLAALRRRIETTLLSLVGADLAKALAVPLAKGDLQAAAKLLPTTSPTVSSGGEAPTFLSAPGSTPAPVGEILLAVVGRLGENLYAAEAAGKSWTLHGPSEVPASTRMVAHAWPLPEGSSLWTPAPSSTDPSKTPIRTELPARLPAGPEGAAELLRWAGVQDATPQELESLGDALARTARDLLEDLPAMEGRLPQGSPQAPTGAAPRDAAGTLPAAPDRDTRPDPGTPPSEETPAEEVASGTRVPSRDAAAVGRIPSDVALRVLAAWATGLPDSPIVRRAVAGGNASLPEALEGLERETLAHPGRHPRLEAVLARVREVGLPAATAGSDLRRELEAAVVEAMRSGSGDDAGTGTFRRAAESLLADRLPDSAGGSAAQAHWTPGGSPRPARIVVRDERGRRGRSGAEEGVHAVEISMDPPGLGEVGARLELRGRILTTRLEAADPATAELARSRIHELSAKLSALGLEPAGLEVRVRPAQGATVPRRREAGGSLDVRA